VTKPRKDEVFGTVEAVKTVSDLFLPLRRNCELNDVSENTPEAVNADPYGAGWMIKLPVSDVGMINVVSN
jgi:glycine cleavage system H protein